MKRFINNRLIARSVSALTLLAMLFQVTAAVALAQATTGSIRGVVTDQAGAVVIF